MTDLISWWKRLWRRLHSKRPNIWNESSIIKDAEAFKHLYLCSPSPTKCPGCLKIWHTFLPSSENELCLDCIEFFSREAETPKRKHLRECIDRNGGFKPIPSHPVTEYNRRREAWNSEVRIPGKGE